MSAPAPEATGNDSRGARRNPGAERLQRFTLLTRGFLATAGVVGIVLLTLATRATIIQIRISTTGETATGVDTTISGADRHGPALVILGAFAAMMLTAALRGARPAMAALAASGLVALGIAIVGDAAHIHDTGIVGQLYSDARAGAGRGFYLETLGGALLLMAGGGLLLLGGDSRRPPTRPAPPAPPRRAAPTTGSDWFSD